MLVLAGINSSFFIVAVLMLGFSINHTDNTGMLQPRLRGHTPTEQRDITDYVTWCSAIKLMRRKRGNVWSNEICLPKSLFHVMEPCSGWAPAQIWDTVNEFFVLLCLCAQLQLYPWAFSPLLIQLFPPSHWDTEWAGVWGWAA